VSMKVRHIAFGALFSLMSIASLGSTASAGSLNRNTATTTNSPSAPAVQVRDERRGGDWNEGRNGRDRDYRRGGGKERWDRGDRRRYSSYNRGHHGPRYRDRRPGYGYAYGGYYYATPWWLTGPGYAPGYYGGGPAIVIRP